MPPTSKKLRGHIAFGLCVRPCVVHPFVTLLIHDISYESHARVLKFHISRLMTKPQNHLCAQRSLRSAWASAWSDQSLRCSHEETLGPQLPIERTAKTDQTGWVPRLIRVFAGRTDHFVGFVMRRLILIPHGKLVDPYSFLVRVICHSGVMLFERIRMESCQQDKLLRKSI